MIYNVIPWIWGSHLEKNKVLLGFCFGLLWGFVKFEVYANKPQTILDQKMETWRVITEIKPSDLEKIFENLGKKVMVYQLSHSGLLVNIIFYN